MTKPPRGRFSSGPGRFFHADQRIPARTDFRAEGTIMGPTGLTAVFGMGTGVAPPVWSPEIRPAGGQAGPGEAIAVFGSVTPDPAGLLQGGPGARQAADKGKLRFGRGMFQRISHVRRPSAAIARQGGRHGVLMR
jgi:hypothetical protein